MATREHWEIDPRNEMQVWERVIGKIAEDPAESVAQAKEIFDGRYGVHCLEIGAGAGRLLREANRTFYEPWGVDSSISLVAYSTRYLQNFPRCHVVLNDGFTLPFRDGFFEFVYSFTCFQHMEDLTPILFNLREAFRVLTPGGDICIQTVCGNRDDAGKYDGYVFHNVTEFAAHFSNVGFIEVEGITQGDWIWVRAKKPAK